MRVRDFTLTVLVAALIGTIVGLLMLMLIFGADGNCTNPAPKRVDYTKVMI